MVFDYACSPRSTTAAVALGRLHASEATPAAVARRRSVAQASKPAVMVTPATLAALIPAAARAAAPQGASQRRRRSSAYSQEFSLLKGLHGAFTAGGAARIRRGSAEASVLEALSAELRRAGLAPNEDASDDDVDVDALEESRLRNPGGGVLATPVDGRAILTVIFSRTFNRVASVAFDGTTRVFDPCTGELALTFCADHAPAASGGGGGGAGGNRGDESVLRPAPGCAADTVVLLTSATLDPRERRLLTACIYGTVKIWNLSNGVLMRVLPPVASGCELTAVHFQGARGLYLPIVGGTTAGTLCFWHDADEDEEEEDDPTAASDDDDGGAAARFARLSSRGGARPPRIDEAEDKVGDALMRAHVRVGVSGRTRVTLNSAMSPAARLAKSRGPGSTAAWAALRASGGASLALALQGGADIAAEADEMVASAAQALAEGAGSPRRRLGFTVTRPLTETRAARMRPQTSQSPRARSVRFGATGSPPRRGTELPQSVVQVGARLEWARPRPSAPPPHSYLPPHSQDIIRAPTTQALAAWSSGRYQSRETRLIMKRCAAPTAPLA